MLIKTLLYLKHLLLLLIQLSISAIIGNLFLNLVNNNFPRKNKLSKTFKRNTLNITIIHKISKANSNFHVT